MAKTPDHPPASRRQFIKGAVAGAGSLAFMNSLNTAQAAPPPQQWDSEVDVLIAGAGVSGCFAAIAAHDAGARNILLLEKTAIAGGSGRFSSGTILAAGTIMQKEKNIQDSAELWYRESMAASENGVDAKITRKMIDVATEVFDFLWAAGMRWSFIDPLPGYSAPRGYREANGGAKMMKIVVAEVAKRPEIKLQYDTRITKLYLDQPKGAAPQGEVVGIECATADGRTRNIKVKKAVALCTGDFAANPAYLESHFPALKNTQFVGNPGNTGDGIRIAQRLGADITGYTPQGHPHCVEVSPGKADLWPRYEFLAQAGALLVNGDGKRFCDEPVQGYYVPLFSEAQKQNGNFACVFDAPMAKAIMNSPRFETTFRGRQALFTEGLSGEGFIIKKADTLDELAKKLGIGADGLKKTVAAYNDMATAGKDAEFQRNPKYLIKMESPPYYGWRGIIGVTTTRGGLRMDAEARILDVDLQPIRRLYGAGGTVGGYTNEAGYRSGLHLTNAFVFGRIAGKNMAAEKPWS